MLSTLPRRLLAGAISLTVVILGVSLLAPPASASFSGKEGLIAFVRGGNIYTASASGGSIKQLTKGSVLSGPRWSPDGKQLAYKDEAGVVYVRTISTGKAVVVGTGATANPVWAPDGVKVAWSAINPDADDCDHRTVVMSAYATGQSAATIIFKPVNECPYDNTMKLGGWAADGTISLTWGAPMGGVGFWLSEWSLASASRVANIASAYCYFDEADAGTCSTNVNVSPGNYSPDQTKVLFSGHGRGLPGSAAIQPSDAQDGVWVVDRAGTTVQRIGTFTGYSPTWSPTGKSILFTQKSGSTTNIMKSGVTATSTAAVLIKNASQADWQPAK